jgi:glycosyltransferase involved in cell wall biosynthesis
MALRQFDLVVAVARPQAIRLVRFGIPATRIRVVLNAWCPDQVPLASDGARAALGIPLDRFHLGWVGRLSWEKGADIFLDAVSRLKDLPIAVSMVGDGAERRALEGKARRLGVGSLITWWGRLPAASRFFPGFDAFVISSRTEGTPIVLFEAMRSGVPVVAAAVGGIPDVVSDNEAVLVPPRDPAALAGAIRSLYDAPHAAAVRAGRARQRLSDYDEARWLQCYQALYDSTPATLPLDARSRANDALVAMLGCCAALVGHSYAVCAALWRLGRREVKSVPERNVERRDRRRRPNPLEGGSPLTWA